MVVETRSARAAVREGSLSPPRDPRGPAGIPMPDGRMEGVRLPPPPPVRTGLGGPSSPRPDLPSPHSSDGRSTLAHSPFARSRRQRPGKAPAMTSDDRPSTSQPRRGGRDRPRSPSVGDPYLPTADLHRTVSAVLEQMGVPIPTTSGRMAPQRHPLGPERPTGDVRVLDELDRRPSPRRGPYVQTPHPDRRCDDRPTQGGHSRDYRPDESGLRGARPYDDRCDYRGDHAPVVSASGAQDHGYPDRRVDPPRPVSIITMASTPPALEETCVAAETTTPDRSIPAMIVIFPSAHHRARTTTTPTIGSMTTGITPARHDISTTIEISTTDVMTPIVVERTIAFVCRRA